jgi:hypothetical protein
MGSRTMTTTTTTTASAEMMVHSSNYIHCVASDSLSVSPPSFHPPTSPVRKEPAQTIRNFKSPEHTSFDLTPVTPAWYVKRPPEKSRLRNWLDRQYYQFEVTWGLYVLTPTEKLIINTLVLSFLSLIIYGFTKIFLLRYIAAIVWKTGVILLRHGGIILRELGELLLDTGAASSIPSSDGYIISSAKNICRADGDAPFTLACLLD